MNFSRPHVITVFTLAVLTLIALPSVTSAAGSRSSFGKGWLFARFGPMPDGSTLKEPGGLEKRDADDSKWRALDVPHDWGIEGPFRAELESNTGKLPWAGIGWYRKHFKVPGSERGKLFFVDFDGAMSHAKVFLNGNYIGEWPYGYASFRLEMTNHLVYDGDNVLAVRLDNPPKSSRWYPGGGIYRNVWITETSPVHVAHWGTTVTSAVGAGKSNVHIVTEIVNQSSGPAEIVVLVRISERWSNTVVATAPEVSVKIPEGSSGKAESSVEITAPRLWDLNAPNLYRAESILRQNGKVIDSSEISFGIRTAEFSADKGFLLNGKRVMINGVCDHHDLGPLGTAVNVSALERQIRILQEMGCNAIRTSHNPPAPELLDACDRMGMVVLDEAFDCWIEGKTPNDYNLLYREWHERDIRAFVRRDRNHPSVIAWSAGNEVREQKNGDIIRGLVAIFHSEDPTRPVTSACDNPEAGFDGFQKAVDIFGYNYKPHLYGKFRDSSASKPLFGSETASCVSTNGEYFFPVSDDKSKGFFSTQVSSYDLYAPPWATIPDVEFEGHDRNPFVAGEFVWTGFDYLGEPTPYGEDTSIARSSYFGIVDLCGFKKDRFYLYQARWRPELPMAHILPHWNWPDRVGKVTPVHVYTTGDEAELFLNGKTLGRKAIGPYKYRLRWDDVKYAPGELKVVAYKKGKPWAEDVMKTAGAAAKIELTVDRSGISADGLDLAFVTAKLVDRDGRMVPTAMNPVRFTIDGPGALAATGNGDPTDHESFQSSQCKAFHGQCLLVVKSVDKMTGDIRIAASADGLGKATLVISSNNEAGHH